MTIANTTNRTSVVGNGAVGQEVPILFPYTDTSDLIVYSRLTSTGAETLLTETTNYTLTAGSDTGGTLTTVTAVAATSTIHIIRDTPTTQTLDLEAGGTFNAENIEDALDKNMKLSIENADSLERCLRLDDTDSGTATLPNAVDRAGKYLYFGDDGAPSVVANIDTSANTISAWGETLLDDADATAGQATLKLTDHTATLGLANLTTKAPLFNVIAYGAIGDGTDDTAAIQAAATAASAAKGMLYFPQPSSYYKLTTPIILPDGSYVSWTGSGGDRGTDIVQTGANQDIIRIGDTTGTTQFVYMAHLNFQGPAAGTGDGIVLTWVNDSLFEDIDVEYGVNGFELNGCLRNTFIKCHTRTGNTNSFYLVTSAGTTCNGNTFIGCWAEAGAGGTNGFYLNAGNQNNTFIGCGAESLTGYAFYAIGCSGLNLQNFYMESTTSGLKLDGCYGCTVDANAYGSAQAEDAILLDSCTNCKLTSASTHGVILDPDTTNCEAQTEWVVGTGTIVGLTNYSPTNNVKGARRDTANYIYGSRPNLKGIQLVKNGGLENWSDSGTALPDQFTNAPAATIVREGTVIKTGTYSAKITVAAPAVYAGGLQFDVPTEYKGQWITIGCWMRVSNAAATNSPGIRWIDGLTGISATATADTWQWLQGSFKWVAETAMEIVFGGNTNGDIVYVDGIEIWAEYPAFSYPITLTDSATPTVSKWGSSHVYQTGGTANDPVTAIYGGYAGQEITIISKHAVIFDADGARLQCGTTDLTTASGDVTKWVCEIGGTTGSVWRLISFMDMSDNLS